MKMDSSLIVVTNGLFSDVVAVEKIVNYEEATAIVVNNPTINPAVVKPESVYQVYWMAGAVLNSVYFYVKFKSQQKIQEQGGISLLYVEELDLIVQKELQFYPHSACIKQKDAISNQVEFFQLIQQKDQYPDSVWQKMIAMYFGAIFELGVPSLIIDSHYFSMKEHIFTEEYMTIDLLTERLAPEAAWPEPSKHAEILSTIKYCKYIPVKHDMFHQVEYGRVLHLDNSNREYVTNSIRYLKQLGWQVLEMLAWSWRQSTESTLLLLTPKWTWAEYTKAWASSFKRWILLNRVHLGVEAEIQHFAWNVIMNEFLRNGYLSVRAPQTREELWAPIEEKMIYCETHRGHADCRVNGHQIDFERWRQCFDWLFHKWETETGIIRKLAMS